jgi:hypothetical protein
VSAEKLLDLWKLEMGYWCRFDWGMLRLGKD